MSLARAFKRYLVQHHRQLRWVIPNRYFAFRFAGGRIYLNIRESPTMLARALGMYEPETRALLSRLLRPGDTFADIGGNKGDYALLGAKLVGPSGKVLCFEPEPTNCEWIQRSIALNGYGNVRLFPVALSDRDEESVLHLGEKSGFHSLLPGLPQRNCGVIPVQVKKFDNVVSGRVDVMKVDVEGAELHVLRGAIGTLRSQPRLHILLSIHRYLGVNPEEVRSLLRELGFGIQEISGDDILASKGLHS